MAITTLNNRSINRSDTASADQVWTATSATASDFQAAAGGTNTPNFYVNKDDAQSIAANTTTKVAFDDVVYDTASAYDASNYKYVIPAGQGGTWFIHGCIRTSTNVDSDDWNVYIYKNGSEIGRLNVSHWNHESVAISQILVLAAADYLEIFCRTKDAWNACEVANENFFWGFKLA
jgi:hypothetical protein